MIDAPADSPITAAFDLAGFHEFDRQHELFMPLRCSVVIPAKALIVVHICRS